MKYQKLIERQRYQISILHEDNLSCREIGIRIGVSKSTVSRELKRNCSDTGYDPQTAQQKCSDRRQFAAKKTIGQQTVDYVEFALVWKWSPAQISAVGSIVWLTVSHEWIYQYIYADKRNGGEL